MFSLFGSNRVVGLEFDEGAIRGVEITKKGTASAVSAYAQVTVSDAVREGLIADQAAVVAALEELWSRGNFRTREVVVGVANQGVIIRFALFPKVTPNRLDGLIRFQAQEHLPIPLDTAYLDYDVIGVKNAGEREMLEVLLVAGRKDMVDSFLQVLLKARLKPREIEVLPLTLLRFLRREEGQQVVAAVDVARGVTNMVIADAGKPRLARMMPSGLTVMERQAAATREEGMGDATEGMERERLVVNIQATIGFYQSHKEARPVEKILLSGTGSRGAGLVEGLRARLGLPVKRVNPAEVLGLKVAGFSGEEFVDFSLAASLACRGWE